MTYKNQPTLRQQKLALRTWAMKKSVRAVMCVLMFGLGFLYVVQVNMMSSRGYEMSDLQKKIDTLESDNRRLQVEIANYRSMKSIQERLSTMDLVAAVDATYATVDGSAVAKR